MGAQKILWAPKEAKSKNNHLDASKNVANKSSDTFKQSNPKHKN